MVGASIDRCLVAAVDVLVFFKKLLVVSDSVFVKSWVAKNLKFGANFASYLMLE